jgi:hypothetical protein
MAKKKRRGRHTTYVLLKKSEKKQISEFSKYIPSLSAYKGKSRIKSAEYGAYKRAKAKLRHVENLKPVTEAQAKRLKGKLVGGGIRAIRLRNTATDAHVKVKTVLKSGVVITTNGRDWEYHPIAKTASINLPEALIDKGAELFNRSKHPPWQIHLWTSKGRANEGSSSFQKWVEYIMKRFGQYSAADDFVQGVAILTRDGARGYRDEIKTKVKPPKNIKLERHMADEDEDKE